MQVWQMSAPVIRLSRLVGKLSLPILLAAFVVLHATSALGGADANRVLQSHGTPLYAAAANPLLGFGLDSGGEVIFQPAALSRAHDSGAHWTRTAVYWSGLEPDDRAPADYNWSYADSWVTPLSDAGLIPVIYLTQNPTWAAAIPCGPIDTTNSNLLADFGEFVGAMAARYPQVPVWILYNEADNATTDYAGSDGCFGDDVSGDINHNGVADTGDYALMLAAARDAARQVNRNTKIAISVAFDNFDFHSCPPGYPGGCPPASTFNYNFLPKLFAYIKAHPRPGGAPYADLIAYNYYEPIMRN